MTAERESSSVELTGDVGVPYTTEPVISIGRISSLERLISISPDTFLSRKGSRRGRRKFGPQI